MSLDILFFLIIKNAFYWNKKGMELKTDTND